MVATDTEAEVAIAGALDRLWKDLDKIEAQAVRRSKRADPVAIRRHAVGTFAVRMDP